MSRIHPKGGITHSNKMADLSSKRHFVSFKGFYRLQIKTYLIAKWINYRACDLYIPSSNPTWAFVVTH